MRCIWCNQEDASVREVTLPVVGRWGAHPTERALAVHEEHAEALRAFVAHANRNGRRFVLGIVGVSLVMLVVPAGVTAFGGDPHLVPFAVGAGTALIGAMTVAWPFATPQTVAMLGIERSVRLVRRVGGGLVFLGLAIALFLS